MIRTDCQQFADHFSNWAYTSNSAQRAAELQSEFSSLRRNYIDCPLLVYVAAKATYIRLLHGKISILEGFLGPSSVHRGRTHIVLG